MRQLAIQEMNTVSGGLYIDIGVVPVIYYPVVEIYDVYDDVYYDPYGGYVVYEYYDVYDVYYY